MRQRSRKPPPRTLGAEHREEDVGSREPDVERRLLSSVKLGHRDNESLQALKAIDRGAENLVGLPRIVRQPDTSPSGRKKGSVTSVANPTAATRRTSTPTIAPTSPRTATTLASTRARPVTSRPLCHPVGGTSLTTYRKRRAIATTSPVARVRSWPSASSFRARQAAEGPARSGAASRRSCLASPAADHEVDPAVSWQHRPRLGFRGDHAPFRDGFRIRRADRCDAAVGAPDGSLSDP